MLIDPGPEISVGYAAGCALDGQSAARAGADPHPLRPRRRVRRARQALARPAGLRARARRAPHGRPGEARRERRPPVRRGGGAARAVGRGDPGPRGEPARARGAASATSRAHSGSSTHRAMLRTTSPTSTRRRAWRSWATPGAPGFPPHEVRYRAHAAPGRGHRGVGALDRDDPLPGSRSALGDHALRRGRSPEQLDRCLEALYAQRDLAAEHDQDAFVAAINRADSARPWGTTPSRCSRRLAALMLDMGLARWQQKFG